MLTVNNPHSFDWANIDFEDCCEGNAKDSYFTLKLFDLFEEKLKELRMHYMYENLLSPAATVFTEIEYNGLHIGEEKLVELGRTLNGVNINKEDSLYSFEGIKNTDNLSSNNDLIDILYTREDAFALYPPDKTAKGSPSVSAPTLKILLEQIESELSKRNG
jgi:DNA polymerase-1